VDLDADKKLAGIEADLRKAKVDKKALRKKLEQLAASHGDTRVAPRVQALAAALR
jgi:hypothetical protein